MNATEKIAQDRGETRYLIDPPARLKTNFTPILFLAFTHSAVLQLCSHPVVS
jgi:hypothetical protein